MKIIKHYSELTDTEKSQIVSEKMRYFRADVTAIQPEIEAGHLRYDVTMGNIFTPEEIAEIEEADKVPIQTAEGISKVNAIVGMLRDAARDGTVVGSGPEDAAGAEFRERILKEDIAPNNDLTGKKLQVSKDVVVTSIPTFLWLEPFDPMNPSEPGISVEYCSWDSIVPDSNWRDPKYRDMRRNRRIKQMDIEGIIERWPYAGKLFEGQESINYSSYELRNQEFMDARNGIAKSTNGLFNVIEEVEFIRVPTTVIRYPDGNVEVLPESVDEATAESIVQMYGAEISREEERVLWSSIYTSNGFLLDYGPHWYQTGEYPFEAFVPPMMNGKWVGVMQFALDTIKASAYAETEHVHSLRTINNNTTIGTSGAIENVDEMKREKMTAGGHIRLAEGQPIGAFQFVENRREQTAFSDWRNQTLDQLSRLTVERNVEGGAQSSQESAKAIGARVQQNLVKMAEMFYAYQRFSIAIERKIIKALPLAYPKHKVFRLFSEKNGMQELEVNKPKSFDIDGAVTEFYNNLQGEFDYLIKQADESVTGADIQREQVLEFLQKYGNTPPEYMGAFAMNYPSTAIQKIGQDIEAQKKAQAEAPPPPPQTKLNATLDLSVLGAQVAFDAAKQAGIIPQQEQMNGPAGTQSTEQPGNAGTPATDPNAIPAGQ